jgi:hypothetical protein
MALKVASTLLSLCTAGAAPAIAHDLYTNLTSPSGRTCCDGSECRPAPYRTSGGHVEMLVNSRWIHVPAGAIQYRALPGDRGETGGGHWCGEPYEGGFVTFCAFLPPTVATGDLQSPTPGHVQ